MLKVTIDDSRGHPNKDESGTPEGNALAARRTRQPPTTLLQPSPTPPTPSKTKSPRKRNVKGMKTPLPPSKSKKTRGNVIDLASEYSDTYADTTTKLPPQPPHLPLPTQQVAHAPSVPATC